MKNVTFPNGPIKMAGDLHLPKDFSEDRRYVAIVCVPQAALNTETEKKSMRNDAITPFPLADPRGCHSQTKRGKP